MKHKPYNGWYNYETWCVNLWLTNDERSDNYWRHEQALNSYTRASESDARHPIWTVSEQARFDLADSLKDGLEHEAQDLLGAGAQSSMWADLLGAALSEVNWNEIADAFLDATEGYETLKHAENPE